MEKEPRKVLVVFGENVHFNEGKKYLEKRPTKTHPIQDYVAQAAANKMYYDHQHAELWAVGGDAAGIGISEGEQVVNTAQNTHPEIHIKSRAFTKPLDTYYSAEAVNDGLRDFDHKVKVATMFPITHRLRAHQQLKQQGVKIEHKHWSEIEFIHAPHSTARERNEKRKEIGKILIRPKVYFDMVRETILYEIGFIDRKGKLMRKFSDAFRKNAKAEE